MTVSYLELTAHDPIVARDGRPFGVGQGYRMKGTGWPHPSVVAGSFRTALVKHEGGDFSRETPQKVMEIAVAGVFPVADGQLYLPAPNDCVVRSEVKDKPLRASPQPPGKGGCDFPVAGLWPVMLTEEQAPTDFKPDKPPAWWPSDKLDVWLTARHENAVRFDQSFLAAAESQVRDHVQLDVDTGAAAESRLFATTGLGLTHLACYGIKEGPFEKRFAEITLAARVQADGWNVAGLDMLHPLGGERRLMHWKAPGKTSLWDPPPQVKGALRVARNIRMVLATPAIFAHGWRPGWIDAKTLTGQPPGSAIELTLVGVCIERWRAVSGWALQPQDDPERPGRKINPGPKPVKRIVPAGGVYFFTTNQNAASLAERWLHPVSDDAQDRNDGFGLAVWGTW